MATNLDSGFYNLAPTYPSGFNAALSFVTPFTHRTNISYAELLMELYKWLRDQHLPELDKVLEEFKIEWTKFSDEWVRKYESDFLNLKNDIDATKQDWEDKWSDFIADIVSQLEGLNDQSMSNLINNDESETSKSLVAKFADRSLFENRATAAISYDTYSGIEYSVITIRQHGNADSSVLKSYWDIQTLTPQFRARETDIEDAENECGSTVIGNGAGMVHISGIGHGNKNPVTTRGALIIDGVAVQDFPTDDYWTGYEGFAMLADGTLKGYSGRRGDSVNDAVNDGAIWLESFGPIIVENGNERILSDAFWDSATNIISSLNIYGQKSNGDIVMITAPGVSNKTGGTLKQSAEIALREGCVFAISMDRGGSAQKWVCGNSLLTSSDREIGVLTDYNKRLVGNYIYSNVPVTGTIKVDDPELFYPEALFRPQNESRVPRATMVNGIVQLHGQMRLATTEESETALEGWPTDKPTGVVRVPPHMRSKRLESGVFFGAGVEQGKWIYNPNDGVVRISYCSPNLVYCDLSAIWWTMGNSVRP